MIYSRERAELLRSSAGLRPQGLSEPPKRFGSGERHLALRVSQHGVRMRAVAFGGGEWAEPLSELDFKLCNLLPHRGDPGKDVAWRQPQRQLVRVVENDCVVGWQADRCGDRSRSRDRTRHVGHLHPRILA